MIGFREVAQLVDQLRLVPAKSDNAVLDVRLHFGNTQHFIRIGADTLDGKIQSTLGTLFNDEIFEQFLKLDLFNPRQCEPVSLGAELKGLPGWRRVDAF